MHDMKANIAALKVEGLSHAYGKRRALKDVSFALSPVHFHGPAGTERRRQEHAFRPDYPALWDFSRAMLPFSATTSPTPRARRCAGSGVVFQPRTLDLDLWVMQNLPYHAALHGIGRREARPRAEALPRDRAGGCAPTRCATFRAARCDGSRSRARCCTGRGCWFSTSRRSASTSRLAPTILAMCSTGRRGGRLRAVGHPSDRRNLGRGRPVVLHHWRMLAHGSVPSVIEQTGADDIRAAFATLTRLAEDTERVTAWRSARQSATGLHAAPICHLPERYRLARGPAVPASARALYLRPGAAAGMAIHFRRRLSPGARACRSSRPTRPTSFMRTTSRPG